MELCRLCHSSTPPGSYRSLFLNKMTEQILMIVEKLTEIKISEDDPFPKIVCFNCYDKLISFHTFRNLVLQTNTIFHQEFYGNNAEIMIPEQSITVEEDPLKINQQPFNEIVEDVQPESDDDDCILIEANEDLNVDLMEISKIQYLSHNDLNDENEKPDRKVPDKFKRFKCIICNKRFMTRAKLDIHLRMHNGARPYSCVICTKSFSQKATLTAHARIHTGERPYTCEICHRAFSRSGTLKIHMRIHTGEKPYNCHICGRSFTVKITLTRHLETHIKPKRRRRRRHKN